MKKKVIQIITVLLSLQINMSNILAYDNTNTNLSGTGRIMFFVFVMIGIIYLAFNNETDN